MNDILKAREDRKKLIDTKIDKNNIVTLKVNMFGENKNNNLAKTILGYYINALSSNPLFKNIKSQYISSLDGDYVIYYFDKNVKNLKEQMMKIEDGGFGRLIDLDVYESTASSVRRKTIRPCVVCGGNSFSCIRAKKHSFVDIYNCYLSLISSVLSKLISEKVYASMEKELKLSPKFGSVCIDTSGSHKDLNYQVMLSCAKMLNPYFEKMFEIGLLVKEKEKLFSLINMVGKDAEGEMFKEFHTNCYKGLIFCLGILVCALGRYLSSLENITLNSAISDVLSSYKIEKIDTFGYKEYQNGFLGIRGEVMSNFKTIKKVYHLLDIEDEKKVFITFLNIVKELDDSVLLKRAGSFDKYLEYKEKISKAYLLDKDELNELNEKCIKEGISLGGSCDILVCTIFLKYIEKELNLKELL